MKTVELSSAESDGVARCQEVFVRNHPPERLRNSLWVNLKVWHRATPSKRHETMLCGFFWQLRLPSLCFYAPTSVVSR